MKRRISMDQESNRPNLIAYSITKSGKSSRFTRIGAAWENAKGGYGIRLDALPVGNEIVLLPPKSDTAEPDPD
jgi:hypothetical protein